MGSMISLRRPSTKVRSSGKGLCVAIECTAVLIIGGAIIGALTGKLFDLFVGTIAGALLLGLFLAAIFFVQPARSRKLMRRIFRRRIY